MDSNQNRVNAYANRLLDAVDEMDFSNVVNFSMTLDGTRYKFFRNKSKSSGVIGYYEVNGTSPEPEFADCVAQEVNKLLRSRVKNIPPAEDMNNIQKLTEQMSNDEGDVDDAPKKKRSRVELKRQQPKKEDLEKDLRFFSPPKSTAEDMFNAIYNNYVDGMGKEIRLYSGYAYFVFDTKEIRLEGECSDPRAAGLLESLNCMWKQNRPKKEAYTWYEISQELGLA